MIFNIFNIQRTIILSMRCYLYFDIYLYYILNYFFFIFEVRKLRVNFVELVKALIMKVKLLLFDIRNIYLRILIQRESRNEFFESRFFCRKRNYKYGSMCT